MTDYKEYLFTALHGLVSRVMAKFDKLAADKLTYLAVDKLDRTYMDVTETKTYTLPKASTAKKGTRRSIRHPDRYAATTVPVIACAVGDSIVFSGGSNSTITFDQGNALVVILVSDGVNKWRL